MSITTNPQSFDDIADQYRAARPNYPTELFDFIIAVSNIRFDSNIIEVGCGTGQATVGFAARGYNVLCVEPGPHLALRARQELHGYPGVHIEQDTFETWNPGTRRFSLLFSAQAYHWIDEEVSVAKPHTILELNGTVALIWNLPNYESGALRAAIDLAYRRNAPTLSRTLATRSAAVAARLAASPLYFSMGKHVFPWTRVYSADDYVRLLTTFSDHLALKPAARAALLEAIKLAILDVGDRIEIKYDAVCYLYRAIKEA